MLGSRPRARVVIEASTDSEWVARCLEALGHEVIVADSKLRPHVCDPHPQGQDRPARCPRPDGGVPARRLPPRPSPLRSAAACTSSGSVTPSSIPAHAISLFFGPCFASTATACRPAARRAFVHRVQDLPLPGRMRSVIRHHSPSCVRSTTSSRTATRGSNNSPSRIPRATPALGPHRRPRHRGRLPRRGRRRARFPHAHQLEASLGLVPREYGSGDTQRRGPITKAGHSREHWLLIPAAVSILRRRPPTAETLWTWALRIAARRGKHVAVVALARRLAGHSLCAPPGWHGVFAPPRGDGPSTPARGASPVSTHGGWDGIEGARGAEGVPEGAQSSQWEPACRDGQHAGPRGHPTRHGAAGPERSRAWFGSVTSQREWSEPMHTAFVSG